MTLHRNRGLLVGIASIFGIVGLEAFNTWVCFDGDLDSFLTTLGIFVLIPLLPALVSLFTSNPLRALGACLLFAPWLVLACGGDSMVYIAVVLWGTPSSIMGALITGPVMRRFGVSITPR